MCSDAISCSPTHYYSDEEPNEVARLQTELGKLIEDEFCRSPLDPSPTIDYSSSSHNFSPTLYANHEYRDSIDSHERDQVSKSDFEADFHDQFPEPLSLHLQNPSNDPDENFGQQTQFDEFHYSQHANAYGMENPIHHLHTNSQPFQDFRIYSNNSGSAFGSHAALLDGLTSLQNHHSTLSKHSAFSTPNLSSRIVEGISNEYDNLLTQSYDHESITSPTCDDSKPTGHLFIPQPDDSASPIRLSPIPIASRETHEEPISNPPEEDANTVDRNREYLIFEARGRQLQEAQQEIALLKEEIAQSERLNNHKDILAKEQIERLTRELEEVKKARIDAENRNKELLDNVSDVNNQLSALKKLKEESDNKVADLEAKNDSLSSELVKLSNGVSLNLAKQRENNLTECLNRRHAMAEEVLQENLEISQRRIANKESELISLRKDLESERLRCIEMTSKHNELVESLQNKLKAAQERCTELSSSALCIEVGELRDRIKELLTSKNITDDINAILQEELRDVREQLAVYEQSLNIFSVIEEPELTPRYQLPLFHDTKGGQISTILSKASPVRNRRRSFQSVTFAGCQNDEEGKNDVLKLKRPSSALDVPLSSTWNQEMGDGVSASTPHRTFTTTADQTKNSLSPQISESISALKIELKNALAKYRIKREQITSLYEKLFAARCDLHKAVAERDRAESVRADLQVRVLALEKELNLQPDTRQPTPREIALTGQLERLQADYHHLEAELQTARTRFADAQAAEARAAGAERTARERVEASISEREAAIERTRAACEAHYAAARRRFETQLTAEHENALAQVKQETLIAREEAMAYRNELERVNAMLQEAKEATAQAVQMTMNEAMKERENERIRFWREELPHQIELARNGWMLEAQARAKVNLDRVRAECQAEFDSRMAARVRQHQAELDRLKTPKRTRDQEVECTPCGLGNFISPSEHPLLSIIFSNDLFNELASICGVEYLLPSIENYTGSFLRKSALALVKRIAGAFAKSLLAVISEYGILKKEQTQLSRKINTMEDNDPAVEGLLKMLGDLVTADFSVEINIIRKIACQSVETKNTRETNSEDVITQIKAEVQVYVQSCQERCARTLQKGLSGAHRRACRQLSNRLRTALAESGLSPLSCTSQSRVLNFSQPMRFSQCQIETLLHIIDDVCESTANQFSKNAINGQPIFSFPSTTQSRNNDFQRSEQRHNNTKISPSKNSES